MNDVRVCVIVLAVQIEIEGQNMSDPTIEQRWIDDFRPDDHWLNEEREGNFSFGSVDRQYCSAAVSVQHSPRPFFVITPASGALF